MIGEISASRLRAGLFCGAVAGVFVAIGACTLTTPLDGMSGGKPESDASSGETGADVSIDGPDAQDASTEASEDDSSRDASTEAALDVQAPDAVDGPQLTCDAGLSLCGGSCVVTSSDPANCGGCGHDCLGGGCQDGLCLPRVLASGQDLPLWIALDGDSVYWTNRGEGTVAKVPKSGGPVTQLAAGQGEPERVAVDSTGVYWTNQADGRVMKVPMAGSTEPIVIATGGDRLSGIALDDTYVYFTDEGADTIRRALKEPSQTPGTSVLLISMQDGAKSLLIDGTTMYWTNGVVDGGAVRKRVLPGGPVIDIALAQQGAHDLVLGGEYVYWTNWWGGTVMRSNTQQPDAVVVATSPGSPAGIALDDTHVFWTAWESGKVLKAPIGGGAPQQLAVDQNSPFGIAVDQVAIYWSSFGNGTIMKLAR